MYKFSYFLSFFFFGNNNIYLIFYFHSCSLGTFRRRAARQKRKSSAQENGGTIPHDTMITNGIRQRKTQQFAGSGPGKCCFFLNL